jgi:cytochrome c553
MNADQVLASWVYRCLAIAPLMLPMPAVTETVPAIVEACSACHGEEGIAKDREVPHLAGQNEAYLLNQLRAFRTGRRPHKEMRYEARQLSDNEMQAIAQYYAGLPRE